MTALDADGGVVRLEHGTLHASFQHRGPGTHRTIEAGGVSVEVTGTRFDVTFEPEAARFVLAMREGSVGLRGCGLARNASGNDVLIADCREHSSPPSSVEALPSAPWSIPVDALPDSASEHAALTTSALPPSKNIPRSATSQEKAPPLESLASLVARANAARLTRDAAGARATLIEIRRRFRGQYAAAQAAFDLGTIAFDLERRHAEAADWFRTYRSEAPSGLLAREELGRMMESLAASGDDQAAADAARDYLRDYTGGAHTRLASRLSMGALDR